MKKKNLAEEYARKAFLKRNANNPISIHDLCFNMTDIEDAFNAGRESVVGNIPNLEWKLTALGRWVVTTPLAFYSVEMRFGDGVDLYVNGQNVGGYSNARTAKQAAYDDYKQRIKKVLGL